MTNHVTDVPSGSSVPCRVRGGYVTSPPFTHVSCDDFRVIRANLLDGGDRSTRDRIMAYTVFIDPQPGRVGMSEREAREKGYDVPRLLYGASGGGA